MGTKIFERQLNVDVPRELKDALLAWQAETGSPLKRAVVAGLYAFLKADNGARAAMLKATSRYYMDESLRGAATEMDRRLSGGKGQRQRRKAQE